MKLLPLIVSALLLCAGCEKRDDAIAPPQATTPVPVQSSEPPPVSVVVSTPASDQVPPESGAPVIAKQADVQVYKCKTEQGVTFSDAPCGGNQEQVSVRETSVIDNAGLREKAEQWKQQDEIEAANRAAERAAELKKESVANRCFDANGNQIACGYAGGGGGQYTTPWYDDPYYYPYGGGYPNHRHGDRYRDIPRASNDGRYDARDRVINSRFQDPARTIKRRLGTEEE